MIDNLWSLNPTTSTIRVTLDCRGMRFISAAQLFCNVDPRHDVPRIPLQSSERRWKWSFVYFRIGIPPYIPSIPARSEFPPASESTGTFGAEFRAMESIFNVHSHGTGPINITISQLPGSSAYFINGKLPPDDENWAVIKNCRMPRLSRQPPK